MRRLLGWTVILALFVVLARSVTAEVPPSHRPPTPDDYTSLLEHPDTLVLTNTSDRPIIAWMVQTVTRSSQGYEASSGHGTDAYRAGILPPGVDDGILEPGESATLPKPKPWLREDHRGPGAGVRHYVGAIVFENNEAIGEPKIIERIFERRLAWAREAAAALEALDTDIESLREIPAYWRVFADIPDREKAIAEIRKRAREDYRVALDNLRPQDRVVLERERSEP